MGGDDLRQALGATRLPVVSADEVWAALAEIPDPEIPVISLVDLGVVKGVAVDNGTVRVDLHRLALNFDFDARRVSKQAR